MRRYPIRSRLLGALLVAVYLAVPGGLAGVRACAHHDAVNGVTADIVHPSHHHDGPDAHAAVHGSADHEEHGQCDCIGTCAPTAFVSLAAMPVELSAIEGLTGSAALAQTRDDVRARVVPFLLPWSTAPPSRLID